MILVTHDEEKDLKTLFSMINSDKYYSGLEIRLLVQSLIKGSCMHTSIINFNDMYLNKRARKYVLGDNTKYYLKGNTKCFNAYKASVCS